MNNNNNNNNNNARKLSWLRNNHIVAPVKFLIEHFASNSHQQYSFVCVSLTFSSYFFSPCLPDFSFTPFWKPSILDVTWNSWDSFFFLCYFFLPFFSTSIEELALWPNIASCCGANWEGWCGMGERFAVTPASLARALSFSLSFSLSLSFSFLHRLRVRNLRLVSWPQV